MSVNERRSKKIVIYYLSALVSGFCIMGVETSSARILSPYFGSTTLIWLIEITLIMICIGIGNYIGGRSADKLVEIKRCEIRITKNLLIAFLSITLIPLISKWVVIGSILLASTIQIGNTIMIASIICSIVLFIIPLICMGTISPLLAKISVQSLDETGSVIGKLYLYNIIGSVFGTIIPTLLIIPKIGVKKSFLVFAAILAIMVISYSVKNGHRVLFNSILCILVLGISFSLSTSSLAFDKTKYEEESIYNYINVSENDDGKLSLKTNVFFGAQSVKIEENEKLSGYYYDDFVRLKNLLDNKSNYKVLIVGYGTGTMSTLLHKHFENIEVTGVEIDKNIVNLKNSFFGDDDNNDDDDIIISDGRTYLYNTSEKYDLIVLDVYQNISMPIHLTTVEFFEMCKNHLDKNGIIALNVGLGNSLNSNLVRSLGGTVKCIFPNTYKYKTKNDNNVIIYGSEKDLGVLALEKHNCDNIGIKKIVAHSLRVDSIDNIFSDDLNNIEQLQEQEFDKIIKTQMNIKRN